MSNLGQIKEIEQKFKSRMSEVKSAFELNDLRVEFLGRKGFLAKLTSSFAQIDKDQRAEFGCALNSLKVLIEAEIKNKEDSFVQENAAKKDLKDKDLDLTGYIPGDKVSGNIHLYTKFIRRIEDIFTSMGFSVFDGPEVETDFYNFGALNIPEDHPARDMYDTLWLNLPRHLLRTHTSPVQIRAMLEHGVPIAGIAPGRVFRHEATDATHEVVFTQCEGLLVDKGINFSHLIGVIKKFLQKFFDSKNLELRMRPGYFPFVEPGVEFDIKCVFCKSGCNVCKGTTWIEVFPGGMVHPNVLKAVNVDSTLYSGFAFGFGIERLAMLQHGINDIRLFHSGDIRFIDQF